MKNKLKSEKQLLEIVKQLKIGGKTIVTYNGSFDLLHAGHARSLAEARSLGDALIVLLNSDKSVASYKSSKRPIVAEGDRAALLASIVAVDYVCFFDDINSKRILNEIKPDIHANGADWGRDCLERGVVEDGGGRVQILKWTAGLSTSKLVEKILKNYKTPLIKAVFIDRDGTINHNGERGYIYKKEDIRFLPGILSALKKLSKTDYKIIIATNQSGIGRGDYSEKDFQKVNKYILAEFKKKGIRVDAVYHCPHHPDDACVCRKPAPGMALRAVKDFDISLNDSWMVGDSDKDVLFGREANMKTIKLGGKMAAEHKIEPKHYAENLREAVNIILDK